MDSSDNNTSKLISLKDLAKDMGTAEELPAKDRARLKLASQILVGLGVIFLTTAWVHIYGPNDTRKEAAEVFEFVSTFAPPIVTLVIGFYFNTDN